MLVVFNLQDFILHPLPVDFWFFHIIYYGAFGFFFGRWITEKHIFDGISIFLSLPLSHGAYRFVVDHYKLFGDYIV